MRMQVDDKEGVTACLFTTQLKAKRYRLLIHIVVGLDDDTR